MEETKKITLAEIQAKLKVPKNQVNTFGKYNYRSCEDIVEEVKRVICPLGFWLTMSDEIVMMGGRFYVKATAKITNGTDTYEASAFAREEDNKKGMDSAQLTGATSSYARKYALNGLFAIDDTKDSDATNTHDRGQENGKKQQGGETQAPQMTEAQKQDIIKLCASPLLTDEEKRKGLEWAAKSQTMDNAQRTINRLQATITERKTNQPVNAH